MIRKLVFATAALLGATAAFAQAPYPAVSSTTTPTTIPTPQPMTLPPFGLATTETARVDVINVATASSTGTAASCTGSIGFYNASGTLIGTATTYTIGTGAISSATLPFASGLTSPREEITAVVTPTVPSTSPPPCRLLVSLSTFDTSSGVTHLFIPAGGMGGPGGPAGPFGPGGPPQQ